MVKDHLARGETRCRYTGYSFRLTAMVLLYALSHKDSIYHGLCYTSRGVLVGKRNSSMGTTNKNKTNEENLRYFGCCCFFCCFCLLFFIFIFFIFFQSLPVIQLGLFGTSYSIDMVHYLTVLFSRND